MTIAKADGMQGLLEDLHAGIPERHISYRQQGGRQIPYISWRSVAQILNDITAAHGGCWDSEVKSAVITEGQAVVTVRLTIRTPDGQTTARESVGTADMDTPSVAHTPPMEVAERVAFRRAAGMFGLSLPPQPAAPMAAPAPQVDRQPASEAPRKLAEAFSEYDDCPECGETKRVRYLRCYDCHLARQA